MKKLFRYMYLLSLIAFLIGMSREVNSEDTLVEDSLVEDSLIENMEPVLLSELEEIRGLGGVVDIINNTDLGATLTDNDASNSVTGFNVIDQGSFNDARGVFSIIQNTGNNVIIQDSTIITVTITPE
jgi:hypothetical protein